MKIAFIESLLGSRLTNMCLFKSEKEKEMRKEWKEEGFRLIAILDMSEFLDSKSEKKQFESIMTIINESDEHSPGSVGTLRSVFDKLLNAVFVIGRQEGINEEQAYTSQRVRNVGKAFGAGMKAMESQPRRQNRPVKVKKK